MATVLMTWELGGGIGHLMNLRPLGMELVRRGHKVVVAVKDLSHAQEVFEGTGIAYVAAPLRPRAGRRPFEPAMSFGHVLANIGFADKVTLETVFAAWNTLVDLVKPDLVIVDHSPSALVALHGRGIPCVNVGLGFFCPPDVSPLPHWLGRATEEQFTRLKKEEEGILRRVNAVLEGHGRPVLPRLGRLFAEAETVLATYKEFDHFREHGNHEAAKATKTHEDIMGRSNGSADGRMRKTQEEMFGYSEVGGKRMRYWGHWPHGVGREVFWPSGRGKRVFGYVKPFGGLEALLAELRALGHATVVFGPGLDKGMMQKYAGPTLQFESEPLNLKQVAAECDAAFLNANHGTAATLLLAGKPCLLLPQFTEQMLFGRKVEALGAGRLVLPDSWHRRPADGQGASTQMGRALREVVEGEGCAAGARAFAARYRGFVPGEQVGELVEGWCGRWLGG